MANIVDYLRWRGDVPFEADPLNTVDSLVLAELSYMPFGGIVPESLDPPILLRDAAAMVLSSPAADGLKEDKLSLLRALAEAPRFGDLPMGAFSAQSDAAHELQFAAVSFRLPGPIWFAAFRGTDGMLVGWKEDFNMAFLYRTPGQLRAAAYLEKWFQKGTEPVIAAGHSKGGNFAVSSAVFCSEEMQRKILRVYTFDGPGFREEVTAMPAYKAILPRVVSVLPEGSIIGLLLENDIPPQYVVSTGKGVWQHDPFTWQVERNRLVPCPELRRSSELLDSTLTKWLRQLSDAERESFVESLYDIATAPEQPTLHDLGENKMKSAAAFLKAAVSLPPEQQKSLADALRKLAASGKSTLEGELQRRPEKDKDTDPDTGKAIKSSS